jgi:hypothetical protein
LDRRLGGPQSRSGYGSEKKSQPPPEIEPLIKYKEELRRKDEESNE